jgi:type VI secretion system protein ImpF
MTRTSAFGSKTDPQNRRVVASVFNRLLLVDDGQQRQLNDYDADALRRDVCRSLETLLNTRQSHDPDPRDVQHLAVSAYRYGIPDFTEIGWGGNEQLREFCRRVESAVTLFEPRLAAVRVELYDTNERRDRVLRFRIRARLMVRPRPQDVIYDSVVDPTTYEFEVRTA